MSRYKIRKEIAKLENRLDRTTRDPIKAQATLDRIKELEAKLEDEKENNRWKVAGIAARSKEGQPGRDAEIGDTVTWQSGGDKKAKIMTGTVVDIHSKNLGGKYIIRSRNGKKIYRIWAQDVGLRKVS